MARIFISHSSHDKRFARRLANDLERNGFEAWLDERHIKVGDSIREAIEDGLEQCDYGIIVLTSESTESQWVKLEIDALFDLESSKRRKYILPLLLEGTKVPLLLKGKKYADFRKDYAKGFSELLSVLSPDDSSWDYLSEKLLVEIDFKRVDGSVAIVQKKHHLLARRDGLNSFEENFTTDGEIEFIDVSPGSIKEVRKEGATTYLGIEFGITYNKNEKITKNVTAKYLNAFCEDEEYWDLFTYHPSSPRSYQLKLNFLATKPPIKLWAFEKRGTERRDLNRFIVKRKIRGKFSVTFTLEQTRMLSQYQLHWIW